MLCSLKRISDSENLLLACSVIFIIWQIFLLITSNLNLVTWKCSLKMIYQQQQKIKSNLWVDWLIVPSLLWLLINFDHDSVDRFTSVGMFTGNRSNYPENLLLPMTCSVSLVISLFSNHIGSQRIQVWCQVAIGIHRSNNLTA